MHAMELLHTILNKSCAIKHETRCQSLLDAVESLFCSAKLSLTSIGRHRGGKAKVKNKIKRTDYLLGNGLLHAERYGIYRAVTEKLLFHTKEVLVIVDWSPCVHHENQILKASVVWHGRSMTLYEEVHAEKKLGNYRVHEKFLKRLKGMIPGHCQVTVLTDAGFRTEWFELVKKTVGILLVAFDQTCCFNGWGKASG